MIDREIFDIAPLLATAERAGAAILDVYNKDFSVETKADDSPITEADKRANAIILEDLARLYPGVPVISEETKTLPFEERRHWDWFWLVDPLDGTKEFVKRNGEFTVNIALIHRGAPWAGVVYQPVTETLYYSVKARGAWQRIGAGSPERLEGGPHYTDADAVTVVASRSHMSAEVEQFVNDLRANGKVVEFLSSGSSLKLCLVASGAATVYPRLGPTMEWDTAAAHAVAEGAGRSVLDFGTRQPLTYNKANLLNPWFIVE
ncbi:MAG: 3'(2'),5'-bisphosphate nucleotidase CysQ [Verrucomicrobia bacterium]|nr:3'(2'),5'-bisphosphate nucleotidase CysQ [Verrucomicrobiota bacterium]